MNNNLLMISGDRNLVAGKKGAFYNTIEELSKHWRRIDIICPRISEPKVKLFENVFIHPSSYGIILQPFWIYRKGNSLFNEFNHEVMTVHDYPPFYNGLGAIWLHHKIKINYVEEIFHVPGHPWTATTKEAFYKLLTRILIRHISSKAKIVRVMNENQVPNFLIKAGVPARKIKYMPAIYLDQSVFKPDNLVKSFDVIFVGRLSVNKGVDVLIRAISIVKRSRPDIKCLIVGDGPLRDKIKKGITRLELDSSISMYGWAKDGNEIAQLLNKSKMLVMTSRNEGGPRVVVEAMACGVPVIATAVGIVPDLVKRGYPVYMKSLSELELAAHINNILTNKELSTKASSIGLDLVDGYERAKLIHQYSDFIKSLR